MIGLFWLTLRLWFWTLFSPPEPRRPEPQPYRQPADTLPSLDLGLKPKPRSRLDVN